jgi:hypothetical protein
VNFSEGANFAVAEQVDATTEHIAVLAEEKVTRLDAPRHGAGQEQGRRYGKAFKVVDLAGSVGRDQSDSGVEARKAGETARGEHEE